MNKDNIVSSLDMIQYLYFKEIITPQRFINMSFMSEEDRLKELRNILKENTNER